MDWVGRACSDRLLGTLTMPLPSFALADRRSATTWIARRWGPLAYCIIAAHFSS